MRISWLPRAILVVRVRGGVRRYNASWLPWAILVVLGWCVLHDHDYEYSNRYHDHYEISEVEDELYSFDSRMDKLEDELKRHDISEMEDELYSFGGRMDKLETELKRHNHYGEYADDDHSHSEYAWEGHEH